jgi:xylulokinase
MALLVGLDLGTTSLKAVVFDSAAGRILASAARPTPVNNPRPTWSEHDPELLWQTVAAILREAAAGMPVAGLAIGSMAETGIPLDENGFALDSIIAWYDRRSEPQAAWVESQCPVSDLFKMTGQRVSPSFGITKLLWLRENRHEVFRRMRAWLPLSSYILYRLTGERRADYSIASRSLLLDQNSLTWSDYLLGLAGLSVDQMPSLSDGSAAIGRITAEASAQTGLPEGMLCAAGGHDHLCASFAAGAFQPGAVVDSTGTAQAVVQVLPAFQPDPRLGEHGYANYAHVLPDQVVLKAGLKAAGKAVDWLAHILSGPGASTAFSTLEAAARRGVGVKAGPVWLPHLLESGTPESDRRSRAALVGLRLEHHDGDFFRAMLESLAFWLRHNLEVMQGFTGQASQEIVLLGGTTRLRLLSELKADVLERPVYVSEIPEATAVGAALLAGLACGIYTSPEEAVNSLSYGLTRIDPDAQRSLWYRRLYSEVYRPLYQQLKEVNDRLAAF